jgi:hypothetical protein
MLRITGETGVQGKAEASMPPFVIWKSVDYSYDPRGSPTVEKGCRSMHSGTLSLKETGGKTRGFLA